MKKILTAVLAIIAALAGGNAEAAGNNFKGVTSYVSGDEFRIVMAFDRAPKTIVNQYEKSIQIDVPGGITHPAKRMFDLNKAGIKTIAVYQVKPDLMRIRLFPQKSVKDIKEGFKTSKNGEKLVVSLAHSVKAVAEKPETSEALPMAKTVQPKIVQLEEIKQAAAGETEAMVAEVQSKKADAKLTDEKTLAEAVKTSEVPAAILAPVPVAAEQAATATDEKDLSTGDMLANIQKSLDDIRNQPDAVDTNATASAGQAQKASFIPESSPNVPGMGEAFLKIGSALMIVVALILVISFGAKKYLGAMEGGLGTKKQLKVLSNHFIGVKKNVTIIEVGGEVLVLGVTNSNINLLARYTEPEKIETIKMAHRLPDKPMGVFKKFPLFAWLEKRQAAKKPLNPAFARQVAAYADAMKTAEPKKETIETRKDEMVSSVTRSIADRLKVLEGQA